MTPNPLFTSKNLDLLTALATHYIAGRLSFVQFQELAVWLGCYQYILPAQRAFTVELQNAYLS